MSTEFKLERIYALVKHGERISAALYSVAQQLPKLGLTTTKEYVNLYNALSATSKIKGQQDPKFPHLSKDKINELGKLLRYPFSVLQHVRTFQLDTLNVLVAAANNARSFDLSWNYIFVKPIMNLFALYVKLMIYVRRVENLDRVPQLYSYCYTKATMSDLENTEFISKFLARDSHKNMEAELQPLTDKMYPMFKGFIAILQRILSPGVSFEWPLLNMCDNPETNHPSATFFKMEYLVLMDLNNIVNWFICYYLAKMSTLCNDQQFTDVFQMAIAQTKVLELHRDMVIDIKTVIDDFKKTNNAIRFDVHGREMNRDMRRRRLAMLLEEILSTIGSDVNVLCMKFPIVLATLGYSNFEVCSTLAGGFKYQPDFVALVSGVVKTATLVIKNEPVIERFTLFNLREYDGPYIDSLIHSSHIPQKAYEQLEQFVAAIKTLDIEDYDKGVRYNLVPMELALAKLMGYFNLYGTSHGLLHLAALFNMISTVFFHLKTYNSSSSLVLESAPLYTYWRFREHFKFLVINSRASAEAGELVCLVALCHYYPSDLATLAEWPGYRKEIVEKIFSSTLKDITKLIGDWTRDLEETGLNKLVEQQSVATIKAQRANAEKMEAEAKANAKLDPMLILQAYERKEICEIPVGKEAEGLARGSLRRIADNKAKIFKAMKLLREIGEINIYGTKHVPIDTVVNDLKKLTSKIFSPENPVPPGQLLTLLENANSIITIAAISGLVNPHAIIRANKESLTQATITMTDKDVVIGEMGTLVKMYQKFYAHFLEESITKTYYSNNHQAFLPTKEAGFNSKEWTSRSALRSLYELIGLNGIAIIDVTAVKIASQLASTVEKTIKTYMPTGNGHAIYQDDPTRILEAEKIIKMLCHIGAIMRFRKLLKSAHGVEEGDDTYQTGNTPPHMDKFLVTYFRENSLVDLVGNPNFVQFFGALFAQQYWESLTYSCECDSFTNNAHLISLAIDCLVGVLKTKKNDFDIVIKYRQLLIALGNGILKGRWLSDNAPKKKGKYPYLTMYILLDHMVKSSVYAEYHILEPIVSYHFIRSIYAAILKRPDVDDDEKKPAVKSVKKEEPAQSGPKLVPATNSGLEPVPAATFTNPPPERRKSVVKFPPKDESPPEPQNDTTQAPPPPPPEDEDEDDIVSKPVAPVRAQLPPPPPPEDEDEDDDDIVGKPVAPVRSMPPPPPVEEEEEIIEIIEEEEEEEEAPEPPKAPAPVALPPPPVRGAAVPPVRLPGMAVPGVRLPPPPPRGVKAPPPPDSDSSEDDSSDAIEI